MSLARHSLSLYPSWIVKKFSHDCHHSSERDFFSNSWKKQQNVAKNSYEKPLYLQYHTLFYSTISLNLTQLFFPLHHNWDSFFIVSVLNSIGKRGQCQNIFFFNTSPPFKHCGCSSSSISMTSILTHTVAHSTRPSFRPKTN